MSGLNIINAIHKSLFSNFFHVYKFKEREIPLEWIGQNTVIAHEKYKE